MKKTTDLLTARCGALAFSLLGLMSVHAQVVINDIRVFQTDQSTVFLKNNQPTTQLVFEQVGTGKPAAFTVLGPVEESFTAGTLSSINLLTEVLGPVTSVDPLTVLRQPVLITGDTVLGGITAQEIRSINPGQTLEVSGFTNIRNSRRASRVDLLSEPAALWQLTGYARDITADGFSIGFQPIAFGSVEPEQCPGNQLREGQFVEVWAAPKASILTEVILDTVTTITCIDRDPSSDIKLVPVALEGFLRDNAEHDRLTLGNTAIEISDSTRFINGDASNFQAGIKVEVLGLLNGPTQVLAASEVVFTETRVVLSAPVDPEDLSNDGQLQILGFDVRITDQTRDDDGIGDIGLLSRAQVTVIGFIDAQRVIFADRIRIAGAPSLDRTTVHGPVDSVAQPVINVLEVAIDASDSTFIDPSGSPLTEAAFFEQVGTGALIQVEGGTLNENDRVVTGGVVQLKQLRLRGSDRRGPTGFSEGSGLGTITIAADLILDGSFESEALR